jgi:hypothetical protein
MQHKTVALRNVTLSDSGGQYYHSKSGQNKKEVFYIRDRISYNKGQCQRKSYGNQGAKHAFSAAKPRIDSTGDPISHDQHGKVEAVVRNGRGWSGPVIGLAVYLHNVLNQGCELAGRYFQHPQANTEWDADDAEGYKNIRKLEQNTAIQCGPGIYQK